MKKLALALLIFILILSISCTKKTSQANTGNQNTQSIASEIIQEKELNIKMFVNAPSGLRIRSTPGLDGEVIGLFDDSTEVTVKREDNTVIEIDGIKSRWMLVVAASSANGQTGWVFGGYLSKEKPYRGGTFKTIIEAFNFIYDDLGYYFRLDGYTWDEFIRNANLGNYEIVSIRSFEERHEGNTVNEYLIQSGFTRICIWNIEKYKKNILISMEIELNESNYLNSFPYQTIDEYLNDESFGNMYSHEHDRLYYTPEFDLDVLILIFNNGKLSKLFYGGYVD